jgi:TPR repeat protein
MFDPHTRLCCLLPVALQGLGVKRRSVNRAFMYFYTAAQAGHSQAMYNTAMMQLAGRGTQRSCRPAARLLKQLAEKGLVAVALQQGHEHFFRGQYAQVRGGSGTSWVLLNTVGTGCSAVVVYTQGIMHSCTPSPDTTAWTDQTPKGVLVCIGC